MRRLLLLRHAKTERDAPSGHDRDRRLDARGREDAALAGSWIVKNGYQPDLALVSTATRAQETWALLQPHLQRTRAQNVPELYNASTVDLLRAAHSVDNSMQSVMIVAHNPGLHELALCLLTEQHARERAALSDLPTTGLAILDFATDDWQNISFRQGRLKAFVTPKQIKDAPKN
jgi:phosphohistidine phosphatase